jgi:hypothetical protein
MLFCIWLWYKLLLPNLLMWFFCRMIPCQVMQNLMGNRKKTKKEHHLMLVASIVWWEDSKDSCSMWTVGWCSVTFLCCRICWKFQSLASNADLHAQKSIQKVRLHVVIEYDDLVGVSCDMHIVLPLAFIWSCCIDLQYYMTGWCTFDLLNLASFFPSLLIWLYHCTLFFRWSGL